MESWFTIFALAFSLFLLMDPLGNIPLFVTLLKDFPPEKQRRIILREMLIALVIILLFNFLGDVLLNLLHVKAYTIMISGGVILFLIAFKMIFPQGNGKGENLHGKEPIIVPLATPLVAGPAVLAAVILFSHQYSVIASVLGIVFAWIASTLILLASASLKRLLGPRGLSACEKLMGLLLTLIAVQLILEGISVYAASRHG